MRVSERRKNYLALCHIKPDIRVAWYGICIKQNIMQSHEISTPDDIW